MKTRPVSPAAITFDAEGLAHANAFADRYRPAGEALAQARQVFIAGNDLPARWAGRSRFTVLETGFGLGHNFLATLAAWRADPARPPQLDYVGLELHPPRLDDLARAHAALPPECAADAAALQAAWPPPTANLHLLHFAGGRVRLLLGWGDAAALLPELRLQADAFFLDGFAPGHQTPSHGALWTPALMQALARKAAPDATAATGCVAPPVRDALTAAGFTVECAPGSDPPREVLRARYAPRHRPLGPPCPARPQAREAVVIGAGIAGACSAHALAARGLRVTVLERAGAPASGASSNAAGLFHGTVHPDDGPYARLFRAAALHASRTVRAAVAAGVPGAAEGLLRLGGAGATLAAMRTLLQRQGQPTAYVDAIDTATAQALAGVPLPGPAWHYPGGGWIAPRPWVAHLLTTPGVDLVSGAEAAALHPQADGGWSVLDAQGQVLASAPIVVLAAAEGAVPLLWPQRLGSDRSPWPLRTTRGQVTGWAGGTPLRLPVAGDGYAIPLPAGLLDAAAPALLCGATNQPGEDDPTPRAADDAHNLERLGHLTGLRPPPGAALHARAGLRLHTDDRLPLAGALPSGERPQVQATQGRHWPRVPGLFVLGALGARGLTLAPLLGELVASQATGTPWPLEADLADAVDPVRWAVRAVRAEPSPGRARRSGGGAPG